VAAKEVAGFDVIEIGFGGFEFPSGGASGGRFADVDLFAFAAKMHEHDLAGWRAKGVRNDGVLYGDLVEAGN